MKKHALLIALLVLACVIGLGFQMRPAQKWEYKVEYHGTISDKKLNELGGQGWELVATETTTKNGDSVVHGFYFKRAK